MYDKNPKGYADFQKDYSELAWWTNSQFLIFPDLFLSVFQQTSWREMVWKERQYLFSG